MVKMAIYRAKMRSKKSQSLPQRKRRHMHSESAHCVVKRGTGLCEGYDEKKVYGSAYAACYVVLLKEQECELIANAVAKTITRHVHKKKEVSSSQLAKLVTGELKRRNQHAAFMYETHRDLA